jgi:hypothetical protein
MKMRNGIFAGRSRRVGVGAFVVLCLFSACSNPLSESTEPASSGAGTAEVESGAPEDPSEPSAAPPLEFPIEVHEEFSMSDESGSSWNMELTASISAMQVAEDPPERPDIGPYFGNFFTGNAKYSWRASSSEGNDPESRMPVAEVVAIYNTDSATCREPVSTAGQIVLHVPGNDSSYCWEKLGIRIGGEALDPGETSVGEHDHDLLLGDFQKNIIESLNSPSALYVIFSGGFSDPKLDYLPSNDGCEISRPVAVGSSSTFLMPLDKERDPICAPR